MNFYNAKLFRRVNVSCKNTKKAKEIKKKLPFISEWKLFIGIKSPSHKKFNFRGGLFPR